MSSGKDIFDDDFEFKPLTNGLGFHKKPVSLRDEVNKSDLVSKTLPNRVPHRPNTGFLEDSQEVEQPLTYEELLKSLSSTEDERARRSMKDELVDKAFTDSSSGLKFTNTLPRQQAQGVDLPTPSTEVPKVPFDDIESRIDKPRAPISPMPMPGTAVKKKTPETGVRRSSSNSPQPKLKKAPICLRSIFLDTITVLGISLLFAVSLLYVTQVSVPGFIYNLKNDFPTQVSFAVLFLALYQMYVIVLRSFFGSTIGEWAFDFQIGDDEEQLKGTYPLKVVWRSLVIMLTGIVLLPALSFILRKDITGYFSGIQLYKKRR